MDLIGLIGDDQADGQGTTDILQRFDDAARGGVGEVDVLEDQQHHATGGQSFQRAQDRFEDTPAELFGSAELRRRMVDAKLVEPGGQSGHQGAEIVADTGYDLDQTLIGEPAEGARQCITDGLVGNAETRLVGTATAGEDAGHARDTRR